MGCRIGYWRGAPSGALWLGAQAGHLDTHARLSSDIPACERFTRAVHGCFCGPRARAAWPSAAPHARPCVQSLQTPSLRCCCAWPPLPHPGDLRPLHGAQDGKQRGDGVQPLPGRRGRGVHQKGAGFRGAATGRLWLQGLVCRVWRVWRAASGEQCAACGVRRAVGGLQGVVSRHTACSRYVLDSDCRWVRPVLKAPCVEEKLKGRACRAVHVVVPRSTWRRPRWRTCPRSPASCWTGTATSAAAGAHSPLA